MLKTLQRCKFTPKISGYQGGTGPSLVLIHGVGLRAEAWAPMAPFLEQQFSLTVLDLPGHGESLRFEQPPRLTDYTDAIGDVLTKINGPSIVMGHSMGALIAMDLAIHQGQKVSAFVALNSIFQRTDDAKQAVKKRARYIVENGARDPTGTLIRWFGEEPTGILKLANEQCRKWLTEVDPVGYSHAYSVFAEEDGPSDEALSEIACPALFVTGSNEPNSTPEMSRELANRAQYGTVKIVDEARHMMPMTHAQEVSELLIAWHETNGGRDGRP